jgi:hypothetical protein
VASSLGRSIEAEMLGILSLTKRLLVRLERHVGGPARVKQARVHNLELQQRIRELESYEQIAKAKELLAAMADLGLTVDAAKNILAHAQEASEA